MQFNNTLRLSRFIGPRDGRRIPGRVPQEMLVSTLGPVLDLSTGGMRVLATRPVDGKLDVELKGGHVGLTLEAKVSWARRLGFRRFELGLAFVNVDDELAKILTRISNDHRSSQAV